MKVFRLLLVTVCYLCISGVAVANSTPLPEASNVAVPQLTEPPLQKELEQQRDLYQQALKALGQGRHKQFKRIANKLEDYPLYPYLEYTRLSEQLQKNLFKAH